MGERNKRKERELCWSLKHSFMQPPTRFVVATFKVKCTHNFIIKFDFIHIFIHFNNIVNFNASLIVKILKSVSLLIYFFQKIIVVVKHHCTAMEMAL